LRSSTHQRVAGSLYGEIVYIAPGKLRQASGPTMDVKARLAPQALVELGDRLATYRLRGVKPRPPRPRLGI